MPEEVVPEALELDRRDSTDNALNSSATTEIRIMPTRRMRERTDNYNEEESDSNSEDESPFSHESNEAAISRFEDSTNLETTQLPALFQSMSVGSDTSADSVDSILPEGRDSGVWIGSSSEGSPYSSTSYSQSDSADELSEDEKKCNTHENMLKKLKELSRDFNANYETPSKNKNDEEDESSSTRNIPVSSKNEESDVPASDDDSSDDSSDDSTNKDESEVEFVARGRSEKPYPHSGKKPYNRESPRYGGEAHTSDEGSPYNGGTHFWPQSEESDHASDDNSYDNSPKVVEAELLSCGPHSTSSQHNGKTTYMSEDTTRTDIDNDFTESLLLDCNRLEYTDADCVANYCLQNHPETMKPIIELLRTEIDRHSPTEEIPMIGTPGYGDYNSINYQPLIMITGTESTSQSPENTFPRTVCQPLSSASSSNSIGNEESSPRSYVHESEPFPRELISLGFGDINLDEVCTYVPPQNMPSTQLIHPATLDDVGNQRNVYTQFSDLVVNMQGNVNICHSDGYNSFNTQTESQAQTSPSHTTADSYSSVPTQLTQYQSNVLQHQPLTIPLYNGIQPKVNSLATSRGTVKITRRDEAKPNLTAFGQIGPVQTNTTINHNRSQTRKPIPKTKPKSCIGSTSPSLIPSTIRDGSQLPKTVEIINRQSSSGETSSRQMALWSLSRLPATSAFAKLKQMVPETKAQLVLNVLYEYDLDHYREQNGMGDTYLMSIVRNSNKLSSRFAYITPILDKMMKIPESLTVTNKDGHDALYLAAINCPEYSFVTGVIAATIEKSCESNDIWQRRYNHGETLLHALAARGDSHVEVLQELLAVQKASKHTLFNLSAKNFEGKTPLHVAVKAHDQMRSVKVVKKLMDFGASPVIQDETNWDTPLHMAMSNRSCLEIVQALLRKDGDKAVNILNKMGKTPLHLAASFLNNVDPSIREQVCRQLIAAGGRTDIRNLQNEVPYTQKNVWLT